METISIHIPLTDPQANSIARTMQQQGHERIVIASPYGKVETKVHQFSLEISFPKTYEHSLPPNERDLALDFLLRAIWCRLQGKRVVDEIIRLAHHLPITVISIQPSPSPPELDAILWLLLPTKDDQAKAIHVLRYPKRFLSIHEALQYFSEMPIPTKQ